MAWKNKFSQISAKTLTLGGKQYARGRNEQKIRYADAFQYPPLSGPQSFRLLRILPGVDSDVLSVELFEANLDDKPVFDALSYTWDLPSRMDFMNDFEEIKDKGEQRPILCNGSTVHITMNLYLALLEFRKMKLENPIWSDQICINQQDNKEKIPQLAIMTDIYSSASTVIIWLDTLSSTRGWALDFMEGLPDQFVRTNRAATDLQPVQRTVLGQINRSFKAAKEISSSVNEHAHWVAVLLALSCGWFDRIWTLQEFLLAKRFKILMGSREVPQSAIVKAATQVFDFYATDSLSLQIGINNWANGDLGDVTQNRSSLFDERISFQSGKRYSAAEYLVIARRKEATVRKDLVFAGAGLLEHGAPESINYFSTTREVFSAFAIERLWPQTGIEALSLVGGTSPKVEGLPSWVPDLSTELIPRPLRYHGCQVLHSPIAPGEKSAVIEAQTLHVKTARWSSVSQIGESIWSWILWENFQYNTEEDKRTSTQKSTDRMKTSTTALQERFGLMFSLLDGMGKTYKPTGEPPMDALLNTLLGGIASEDTDDPAVWRYRFYNFFALKYLDIRSTLETKMTKASAPSPWQVPVVQDLPRLEERVSSFIEAHDRPAGPDGEQTLKQIIADLIKRTSADTLKGRVNILRAAFRGDPSHEPASIFSDNFTKIYDGRRIFATSDGYLGISTEDVRADDVVMLVAGAEVPIVFRPVQGKDATFTLVGEAYVHGLIKKGGIDESGLVFSDIQVV